jgi:hypothetical protein
VYYEPLELKIVVCHTMVSDTNLAIFGSM